ncbi:MBL fold metallo-hydrolase [Xanthomonas sp. A2111]|uniref:MBL fold metallo-hydrolase n=1 Tax=Xanthomonas hawaiiensis TaxID=3003247 RepID=A0ABU2IAI2_9XANT|nr:MBL fold metallo-hydrolase [Xanthomonas sp. A2111]MBO9830635.1 MBL fold metallo-hydrolase [Xanthomonas sp. A2111]MDS9995158.1 MBL fold metallo-hydrolase [Xanthomonas sp. A2111]
MQDLLYLKQHTKIEPLNGRWYAWSHLVSPVQHAFNVAFRHVPSLRSFVLNPNVHEAASKNPKMLGSAFMELDRSSLPAVQKLLDETVEYHSHLIQFAQDFVQLDRKLAAETGFSLDRVYEELSPSLQGLVELSYDTNNRHSLRLIEELAHTGALETASTQELAFTHMRDEERNFFLNTPRVDSDRRMIFKVPFADPRIDLLSKARIAPVDFDELSACFGVASVDRSRFRGYFTELAPERDAPDYRGEGVRLRYFGHACVLIQSRDVSVMIDPFLTWDDDYEDARHLCFNDLPDRIDYVFLTHNHQDHFTPELLLQLRRRVGKIIVPRNNVNNVADPSIALALRMLGFDNIETMDWMETLLLPDGALTSLPFYGEHADLSIASKQGMHLRLRNRSFMFLADSDCKDRNLYRRIVNVLGKVDTLFIGMECDGAPLSWLYGSYLSNPVNRRDDNSRRLSGSDAKRAMAIVEEVACRQVYVYAMGQEPWMRYVTGLEYTPKSKQIVESDRLVSHCREIGVDAERLLGCRTWEN